jgi:ferritin-like protein
VHFCDIITAENVGTTIPLIQESRYFIGNFLKVMTRAVKCAVGIIFDCLHIYCLNYIFDEFLKEKKKRVSFFFKFYTENVYKIDIRLPVNRFLDIAYCFPLIVMTRVGPHGVT